MHIFCSYNWTMNSLTFITYIFLIFQRVLLITPPFILLVAWFLAEILTYILIHQNAILLFSRFRWGLFSAFKNCPWKRKKNLNQLVLFWDFDSHCDFGLMKMTREVANLATRKLDLAFKFLLCCASYSFTLQK